MSDTSITGAAKGLREMAAELSDRHIRNALRKAMRAEARRIKRAAGAALKGAHVHGAAQMAKDNIQTTLLRDGRGFRVYVSKRGGSNMHVNRRGLKKPVAFWLEGGTRIRSTSGGYNRGALENLRYMEKAEQTEGQQSAARMGEAFEINIEKTYKKYGY